jgi:peptidyl-prolyl cis-trans isomerase C
MPLAEIQQESSPEFSYHLLRNALNDFGKNLQQLDANEYQQVHQKASKSYQLESLVLAAPEAEGLVIPEEQLHRSVASIETRYQSRDEFIQDLQGNGLDEAGLHHALYRELMFDGVMQRVTAESVAVSEVDVQLFYEMHRERFEQPELRVASHILITVNPDYPENTRDAAMARMEQVMEKLGGRADRFPNVARDYSECPTAMDGGKLGEVKAGQLYLELDAVLFSMEEGHISSIIESEMGLHILLCEKIKPGKRITFTEVETKIRSTLEERQRRSCQKAWLAALKDKAQAGGAGESPGRGR